MGPGWPGAGRQAACSPTSSVGAISTARTWRAFSAEAFVGSTVQSEEQQPTSYLPTGFHLEAYRKQSQEARGVTTEASRELSSLLIPSALQGPSQEMQETHASAATVTLPLCSKLLAEAVLAAHAQLGKPLPAAQRTSP